MSMSLTELLKKKQPIRKIGKVRKELIPHLLGEIYLHSKMISTDQSCNSPVKCYEPNVKPEGTNPCGEYEGPKPVKIQFTSCIKTTSCNSWENVLDSPQCNGPPKDYHQTICRPKHQRKDASYYTNEKIKKMKKCVNCMVGCKKPCNEKIASLFSKKKTKNDLKIMKIALGHKQEASGNAFKDLPMHGSACKTRPTYLEIRDLLQRTSRGDCSAD